MVQNYSTGNLHPSVTSDENFRSTGRQIRLQILSWKLGHFGSHKIKCASDHETIGNMALLPK